MKRFIAKYAEKITGVLSGFDRLLCRGRLRGLVILKGLEMFLTLRGLFQKDKFKEFALETTERLKDASLAKAQELGRPVEYLNSGRISKEDRAREIAARDGIQEGLVCVFKGLELTAVPEFHWDREKREASLRMRSRKCLFLYHYWIDPVFGFMNARIQTWFPFNILVGINGREWLARQMDRAGLGYGRRDNCFVWLEDMKRAQGLLNDQVKTRWISELGRIPRILNPTGFDIFGEHRRDYRAEYYWSVPQSEWATDVMFNDTAFLAQISSQLSLHAMTRFGSGDVMRFLGRKVHGGFGGSIISDFKNRPEGVRVKHRVNKNTVKIYQKTENLVRVETTINEAKGFKVRRRREGHPTDKREWLPMRQGIADIPRRAQVSQASNGRYLDGLAQADTSTPLGQLFRQVSLPVTYDGKRVRALRLGDPEDLKLISAVTRGEYSINGFRNRDLQPLLFGGEARGDDERRRRSAQVTRRIRLLRAHGLVHKVPKTHRYTLSPKGQEILYAIMAAQQATVQALRKRA